MRERSVCVCVTKKILRTIKLYDLTWLQLWETYNRTGSPFKVPLISWEWNCRLGSDKQWWELWGRIHLTYCSCVCMCVGYLLFVCRYLSHPDHRELLFSMLVRSGCDLRVGYQDELYFYVGLVWFPIRGSCLLLGSYLGSHFPIVLCGILSMYSCLWAL